MTDYKALLNEAAYMSSYNRKLVKNVNDEMYSEFHADVANTTDKLIVALNELIEENERLRAVSAKPIGKRQAAKELLQTTYTAKDFHVGQPVLIAVEDHGDLVWRKATVLEIHSNEAGSEYDYIWARTITPGGNTARMFRHCRLTKPDTEAIAD